MSPEGPLNVRNSNDDQMDAYDLINAIDFHR